MATSQTAVEQEQLDDNVIGVISIQLFANSNLIIRASVMMSQYYQQLLLKLTNHHLLLQSLQYGSFLHLVLCHQLLVLVRHIGFKPHVYVYTHAHTCTHRIGVIVAHCVQSI